MNHGTWEQSTFWSEERLANPSALPDSAKDSTTHEADSCLHILRSLGVSGLDGLSGKMSPASCRATEEGILEPSSGRWGHWGMGGPTESWTHSGSEWPSAVAVCSLSQTLETGPLPQRFYLSAKACAGILRRAAKRGKELPPMLREALEMVAGRQESPQLCEKKTQVPATPTKTFLHRGGANLVPDVVGTLSDGAHNGGGLTAKMPTRAAYSPALANPLTARMGKGINTTLDEGQTAIVEAE